MNLEDQKFFEACREMFMSDGWKAFQQEIVNGIAAIRIEACESADDFWMAKGRLQILHQIAGWESAVLAAEAQASEDADEKAL